jgi:general secretion pathway protein H
MICAAGRRRAVAEGGFTLLELMVVLALLGLLGWLAWPQLAAARGPSAELIGRDLVAALRDARLQARTHRHIAVFWLDLGARSYGIEGAGAHQLPADSHLEMSTVADRATATRGTVEFYPDGGASGGRILIERSGRRSVVTVDWLDGSVVRAE